MSDSKVSCRSTWNDVCLAQKWASAFREKPAVGGGLSTSQYNRRGENAVQPECVRLTQFISFYGHISIVLCFR